MRRPVWSSSRAGTWEATATLTRWLNPNSAAAARNLSRSALIGVSCSSRQMVENLRSSR